MSGRTERIRVVVADDHARMRGRICAALEADGCEVCAEAATGPDAVRLVLEHRPDVALLDIHMPGNGIAAAREIDSALPETAVVMLTQSSAEDDIFDSLRAGAAGYLLKDTDPARLGRTCGASWPARLPCRAGWSPGSSTSSGRRRAAGSPGARRPRPG